MKKSLVLAMAMALGVTASAYAANPFSYVLAGHWTYDSVAKLAAAGVVDGYADGAFDGDKLMTRYEMAQIVAKAMAKGEDCDKLAAEFADELDTLGVRVAKLEKGADASVPGSYGVHAQWFDQPINAILTPTTDATVFADGFEGWNFGVDYTLAKNVQLCVNWYDTEAIKLAEDDEVLYSELYFFF